MAHDLGDLHRNRRRRARRAAAGLCVRCVTPAVDGRTLCSKHAAEYAEYARQHKDRIAAYKRSIQERANELRRTPGYRSTKNANRRRRKKTDLQFSVIERLRKRIGRAIRDHGTGRKNLATAALIGCSVADLMAHLEAKFLPGMSWANRHLWHIDHERPCASFDLTDPAQQLECFNFSNLQPLWAKDNIRKHANV